MEERRKVSQGWKVGKDGRTVGRKSRTESREGWQEGKDGRKDRRKEG